jgi:HTH-type transcriptional repressor of NAD biosynthesis genes
MIRGLVIGKFMPIHKGHIALINFAADQCDELIVSMSYTDKDPIPPQLRFSWLCETFKERPSIKPFMVKDDFDNEYLPLIHRTRIWSEFIFRTYPTIDVLFSSEDYGEPFAKYLGVRHHAFDPDRKKFSVSATRIRKKPFQYWEYIPAVVRPYFVKLVCFFGPESTGKSTMAVRMSERYQSEFVPEVARELITSNDFTADDIIKIGHAHFQRIEEKKTTANRILFCDTDAITTQIYSNHYLKLVPEVLFELERKVHYDRYFLMDIDVPWVADGLRDLGDNRENMMAVFKDALDKRGIPYLFVTGSHKEREEIVSREIDKLLK